MLWSCLSLGSGLSSWDWPSEQFPMAAPHSLPERQDVLPGWLSLNLVMGRTSSQKACRAAIGNRSGGRSSRLSVGEHETWGVFSCVFGRFRLDSSTGWSCLGAGC